MRNKPPPVISDRPQRVFGSRFGHRMVALFVVLGLLLSMVAIQVYRSVGDFVDASNWVSHTFEVKQEITSTVASLRTIEANQRAYILSGDAQRLADYYGNLPRIADQRVRLADLVANNPEQVANLATLESLLDKRLQSMTEILQLFHQNGIAAARESTQLRLSRAVDVDIEVSSRRMIAHEDALLAERQRETMEKSSLTRFLTIGSISFCMSMLALALVVVFREQRRRLESELLVNRANRELAGSLDEAQRLGRTLRQLSELGEMLQGCRSLEEATKGLCVSLPRLLDGKAGSISLINASQNMVETMANWGDPELASDAVFGPDDCWALRRGQAYPQAGTQPAFGCAHLHDANDRPETGSHLCLPLLAQGEMLGILSLCVDAPLSDESRAVAVAAAEQVSLALANLKLQETLRTQSLRDPLTGLFNRRYLEVSLEREIQRASRRDQSLSVLMLDIDHFKRFNDDHGHDAGDALLGHFGALLASMVRSEDVACRYGGEEFIIVLQETDARQATMRAEQICAAVRALDVQHRRQTLGAITVSIGIATLPQDGSTPADLMRNADRALYAAKHGGRDQVKLAA